MKKLSIFFAVLMMLAFVAGPAGAGDDKAKDFVKKAAQGGMFEVEAGTLAVEKASNAEVKEFGSMMVTDHGKANEELKAIAQAKGMEIPTDVGEDYKEKLDKLNNASGAEFDREYMDIMVKDHEEDVEKFKKMSGKIEDPELKAWIDKTLPVLEQHHARAKELSKTVEG